VCGRRRVGKATLLDRFARGKRALYLTAQADPSLLPELQVVIDHSFKGMNVAMALCGSNEGFMEGEALGSKSPLHGVGRPRSGCAP
jgi:AAA+ ATPase superfamily predicted ATPase